MAFGTTPVQSVQYAKYAANPTVKVASKDWHARKRTAYGEYEASALAAGSQIAMVRIPQGARLLGGKLAWDAMGGGSFILGVGDQFDCDRFMLAATASVASFNAVDSDCGVFNVIGDVSGPHSVGIGYEFTCDTDIIVTFSYAAAVTGTVKLVVEYATD